MDGNILLRCYVHNGKSTIAGRILTGNLNVFQTLDTDIEKEKGTTIECYMSSFLFDKKKNAVSLVVLGIDSIYLRLF